MEPGWLRSHLGRAWHSVRRLLLREPGRGGRSRDRPDLLERGIAEVSDGLPVVKIDEKLGLEKETYRTLPILRSDGTTLYSTKDLALTKRKFEDYGIDRSVWVIDVRQSLYMQQIFKIMELWGFEQAEKCYHLGYEVVMLPEGAMSSRKGNVDPLRRPGSRGEGACAGHYRGEEPSSRT